MLLNFVDELRAAGIHASLKDHLVLLEALDKDVIEQTPEAFYYVSRDTFVQDEALIERFYQAFSIGSASRRERVCQYVYLSVVAVSVNKTIDASLLNARPRRADKI